MVTQKINKFLYIPFLCILPLFACADKQRLRESGLGYLALLNKEVKRTTTEGRSIPVTIGQSLEIDCVLWSQDQYVSSRGTYILYSSNETEGNYDIYVRDLNDIIKVRLTEHASKDFAPAISPNGRQLAFVSLREDPEGDVYVADINLKSTFNQATKLKPKIKKLDEEAVNLTQYKDPATKTIQIIKDSYPAWSPDGKHIVFSSTRGGQENIWIMEKDGDALQQITTKGGLYPKFSPDGQDILFLSYRDNKNGDIYSINITTKVVKQLTDSNAIKLYPAYAGNKHTIIYTGIDKDTNGDKRIDINDNAVLYKMDLLTKQQYKLTFYNQTSFNGKWYPVKPNSYYNGIVLYTQQQNNNININMIGDYGIVAKKKNARNQFNRALQFKNEFDNMHKYLTGLERVHIFFGNKKDLKSQIYSAKALDLAAREYQKAGKRKDSQRMLRFLQQQTTQSTFAKIIYKYSKSKIKNNKGRQVLQRYYLAHRTNKKSAGMLPYLLEIIGDELSVTNRSKSANIYNSIIKTYPKFERLEEIKKKNILLTFSKAISPFTSDIEDLLNVMDIDVTKHILNVMEKEKNVAKKLSILSGLKKKYSQNDKILPFLHYIEAETYYKNRNYQKAQKAALLALNHYKTVRKKKTTYKSNYITYISSRLLGSIYNQKSANLAAPFYYITAITFRNIYKDGQYKKTVEWLINYYQQAGEQAFTQKNFKRAEQLYNNLIETLTTLRRGRQYPELYNKYSSKAHVLYIDSVLSTNREANLNRLVKKYSETNLLIRKKIEFDKAHFYALAYLYSQSALVTETKIIPSFPGELVGKNGMATLLRQALEQLDWALFIDDTYIDAYILQSWIFQLIDVRRKENSDTKEILDEYFPPLLLEANRFILEKALAINDESVSPENEGNLHLNLGNNHFILTNYSRALFHYNKAAKMKKQFSSPEEEALFYFHMGYCYWQKKRLQKANTEIQRALYIYESMTNKRTRSKYAAQTYILYKYFALFSRLKKDYEKAIFWYNTILTFTKRHNIKTDRARYYQEIAYCYKMLGDFDTAIAYLKKASKALKKYPEDDTNLYKLYIHAFWLIPVPWDMGEGMVVGNNKLHTELDTLNKKILNITLYEEIAEQNRNYHKVIKYLKKKIALHKQRDYNSNKRGIIIGLNNIGYYYFKLGNYKQAYRHFKESWDRAKDEDMLEEIFSSIMNIANLYAYTIENNIKLLDKPQERINRLNKDIDNFKNSYEKARYETELEDIEEVADIEDRKVTESKKKEIQEKIREDARVKYYKINIAIGVLQFYQAELLWQQGIQLEDKTERNIANYYNYNKKLYDLYNESMKRFDLALQTAEKTNTKKLIIKLKLNMATCSTRIGQYEDAYRHYLEATRMADSNRFHRLQFICKHKLAYFLYKHGLAARTGNSPARASQYYQQLVTNIEEMPSHYIAYSSQVHDIYTQYTTLLLQRNKIQEALFVSEKSSALMRIFLVNRFSPELSHTQDRTLYDNYNRIISLIDTIKSEISDLYTLSAVNEEKTQGLEKKLADQKTVLRDLTLKIKASNSYLKHLLVTPDIQIPVIKDTIIVKFETIDNDLLLWTINDGKAACKKLRGYASKNYIQFITTNFDQYKNKKYHIIFNNFTYELIKSGTAAQVFPPCMYTNSISNIADMEQNNDINMANGLLFSDTIDPELAAKLPIQFNNTRQMAQDITGYPIIAEIGSNQINPTYLFNTGIPQSQLIIKDITSMDYNSAQLFYEAARYSSIRTLIFTFDTDNDKFSELANKITEVPYRNLQNTITLNPKTAAIGANGSIRVDKNIDKQQQTEYTRYQEQLKKEHFESALYHLTRWHLLIKESQSNLYNINSAELAYLNDSYKKALTIISGSFEGTTKNDPLYSKMVSLHIYLNILNGNITQAKSILDAHTDELPAYADYTIYTAIIQLHNRNAGEAIDKFQTIKQQKSLLPLNRLRFLFIEHACPYLTSTETASLYKQWQADYPMSQREKLKQTLLGIQTASSKKAVISALEKNRVNFQTISQIKSALKNNETMEDSYTNFQTQFILATLISSNQIEKLHHFINSIEINETGQKSHWLDKITLYSTLQTVCEQENLILKAREITQFTLSVANNYKLPLLQQKALYDNSLLLLKQNSFKQSYDTALKGEQISSPDSPYYNKFKIMLLNLESMSVDISRAEKRINMMNIEELTAQDQYNYMLLQIKLNLINLSKKKKITQADAITFEDQFSTVLTKLNKNPRLLDNHQSLLITRELFDEYINYKMKTSQFKDALYYTEIKKGIFVNTKFHNKNSNREVAVSIKDIQKYIPQKSALVYLTKIKNDVFAWVFTSNRKKALILKDSYPQLQKVLHLYNNKMARFENVQDISALLAKTFGPISRFLAGKEDVLIIADNHMEKIPFEIMGKRDYLAVQYNMLYLSSLTSLKNLADSTVQKHSITVYDTDEKDQIHTYLEKIAIHEILGNTRNKQTTGLHIYHFLKPIVYNGRVKALLTEQQPLSKVLPAPGIIYLPNFNFTNISYNDFSYYGSKHKVKAVIINDTYHHDTNNAFFVNYFYSSILKQKSVIRAFQDARKQLISSSKYNHPAYWAGLRLYLN